MKDAPVVARRSAGTSAVALAVRAALGAACALMAALTFAAVAGAQESAVTVDFSYSPAAPRAGERVTFVSTSTPRAKIRRESWDFNGDMLFDARGPLAAPKFLSAYTYNVTLEVEDDTGLITRTTKPVTVAPAPEAPPPDPPPPPAPPPPSPPPPPPPSTVPTPTIGSATPAPPTAIAPFPVVRISGIYTPRGVRLRLFAVTAPVGVTITVRCQGRGCPYRQRGPLVVGRSGTRPANAARYVRIGGFRGRLLRPGVRLQVFVGHPRQIGKYTRFTIRRGHPPQRADNCLGPSGAVFSCG